MDITCTPKASGGMSLPPSEFGWPVSPIILGTLGP